MLTEVCEYDYKGVIKAAEHNFNTFLKSLFFYTL